MLPQHLAASVGKCVPMLSVPDVAEALDWYLALGFREVTRFAEDGCVNFAMVAFGKGELMLVPELFHGTTGTRGLHDASLWFYTDEVEELYRALKAVLAPPHFIEELYDTFYGAREFGIRDLNGYVLYFIQSL